MAKNIRAPRLRISRRIKKDQVFKIKVKFDHPSFTGLGIVDDETEPVFNRAIPVSFIRNMLVYYGEQLVSRFRMSSAISDDPLFTFKLKAVQEAPVKVVFVDNQGKRWETSKMIKFKK
ncbi:MAG: thiosulfate oxidation carrier complex protein SoxZ [SAR324 cluster bacterium]|nr:thiosulfate oxidation carrier complex protein SoxZ [SAR324 cluster bacterium]MBL7035596.1 thiosulfate oxidation carrier complex protein SoxZ [SAR324 cluster bacterium]